MSHETGNDTTIELSSKVKSREGGLDMEDYSNNLKSTRDTILVAELKEKENTDNILLALNQEQYDHDTEKQINLCLEKGIAEEIHHPFYNEISNSKDYVDFQICDDKRTIKFSYQGQEIMGEIKLKSVTPQKWNLSCFKGYEMNDVDCNSLKECFRACVDLCIEQQREIKDGIISK